MVIHGNTLHMAVQLCVAIDGNTGEYIGIHGNTW